MKEFVEIDSVLGDGCPVWLTLVTSLSKEEEWPRFANVHLPTLMLGSRTITFPFIFSILGTLLGNGGNEKTFLRRSF